MLPLEGKTDSKSHCWDILGSYLPRCIRRRRAHAIAALTASMCHPGCGTEEYEKLRRYDAVTSEQPPGLFQCQQADAGSATRRICAGWAGCHGPDLLGLRVALLEGWIDEAAFQAAVEYRSPVPLFGSGNEAADHGQADIHQPTAEAAQLIGKISRTRSDLRA
ncbi:DUF6283 family protein [Streptomyces sparsogenes]|uniref:DUF6283 family protein n=1 Tax=Streptomyces sparsogenes TaxID=67365 RepID=UPI00384ADE4E